MVQELRLFRFVDGVNDTPFPNKEANDEQIVITSFAYNAQRMAATPTITASIDYYRCLDDDWDVSVYAEYKGEKYYIRQIPSSSKSNTSVMYKHDLTLYSERFVLENIYFTDIEKKTENGVDVFVKRETTSITYRFNLIEYVDRLNWSLEASNLPYRVSIDSSILNSDKAKEIKDISLENAYLANAIQEIYNQWETFFYFNGNNIIIKDCSENINDVVLEYGAENSLLSIKKNNANFRKITRISGYGSDKNIPFYYPNWSQKGVIDVDMLEGNSILTKDMITITDMKKFDKLMPLNGKVQYKSSNDKDVFPSIQNDEIVFKGLKYKNQTSTDINFTIPFNAIREKAQYIEIYFDVDITEALYPAGIVKPKNTYIFEYTFSKEALGDMMCSPVTFENSYYDSKINVKNESLGMLIPFLNRQTCHSATIESSTIESSIITSDAPFEYIKVNRTMRVCLVLSDVVKGECTLAVNALFSSSNAIRNQEVIGYYTNGSGGIFDKTRDYIAALNESENYIDIKLSNFSIKYPTSNEKDDGWYINDSKKIELSDIGISLNGTPNDDWSGEGFTQKVVSKIPTAQNLMPSVYRNSIGERKFYNAINYPRSAGSNDQDSESGEILKGLMYENDNYKENNSYYNFETLWTPTNQNEHIQDFEDIYPSITNITNANNQPIDEILEVAFDDNDNNEVDEEGNYIHPYFYVRIPKFDGNNGFNLFDHKIVGGNMQVAMTSGDCAACNFEIMVKTRTSQGNDTYEDVVNPIKLKENGTLVDGDSDKKTAGDFGTEDTTQQDSRNNSIWLVLKKDNQTFNEAYPNKLKGVVPKVGDKFVLLNIDMPRSYVLEAEEKLTKEIIKYMSQNNSDKWNFDIDFSRIFLQENQYFYSRLDENCKLYVKYNGLIYNFYVNNYKYEVKSNEALPKITVGLVDTITVNRGVTQNIVDGVMKAIQQTYDVEESIDNDKLYLRKTVAETMPNEMTFEKKVIFGGEVEANVIKSSAFQSQMYSGNETMGAGFKLEENENGESTLTVDNVNVRKKLKATEFVIQQIQFQGGIVIQSAAAMECNDVETLENGNFKCYFDTKEGSVSNQFMLDDLARCQRVGYAPKYYWRKVVEIGSDYIVLSNVVGEYEEGSDVPSAGDIIVQMGNTTNTNRQSAIEMNTVGENSPSFIMYSGITTFSLLEKDTTGIVYHQKVVDANGNVTLEAYPELYSYGSMYFGDRNKQNNFIQFAPNANGTFEMLINAKTSFQGGTSDLSNALDSLLSGVQGAQNTANSADSKATQAQTAATNAQNAINNLKIGGTNLLLKSDVEVSNANYQLASYDLTTTPIVGNDYTITIWGQLGEGKTHFWCFNSSGTVVLGSATLKSEGVYSVTFKWTNTNGNGTVTVNPTKLYIYSSPSSVTDVISTIEKIKLEEGNISTSWTPAPEDVTQAITDAEDRTMEALANEVQTINGGIEALQKQVDGEVTSWFMQGEPTLTNEPAVNWTTDEEKLRHEGDTYTDITTYVDAESTPTAGQSWRWCNVDDEYGTGWHWHKIADNDAIQALARAGEALATANGKSTTFVVQPSNYSKGDLWILASDTTVNGTTYKSGTILTANEPSTTYVASHWVEKVKYTDDELASQAFESAIDAQTKAQQAQTDANNAKNRLDNWASDSVISPTEKQGIKDEISRINADKAQITAEYTKYSLGTPSNYNTAYTTYYNQLVELSAPTPESITIPTNFATNQTTYYTERTNALNAISEGAKTHAEAYASKKAEDAKKALEEDIQKAQQDAEEALESATNALSTASDLDTEINKAFSDWGMNKTDQKAIANSYEELKRAYMSLDGEYADVVYSVHLDDTTTTFNGVNYNTPKTTLVNKKVALNNAYIAYEDMISLLVNFSGWVNSEGKNMFVVKYEDIDPELSQEAIKNASTAYNDSIEEYKLAISVAQENIRKNMQNEAERIANNAVNNIQIGGRNILPFNALTLWVAATYTKARPKYILTTNSNNQCGLYFSESYIKLNTEYVLSFKMKKLSGNVTRVGGYLGESDISEVWIDGVKVDGKWKDSVPITNDTNEHYIVVKFTQTAKTTGQKIYIQPNRNYWSACQVEMYEFQLEQGNRATSYKENESDKILASENILKDSFRLSMSSDVNTQWRFTKMNLTTNLKPNTEYVLSCFKSSAQSSNSSYPTATKFSVRFMDSGHTYTRLVVNLDISSELQVAKFTTPSNVTSTDAILVYGGHIMDENQNVTTNGTKAQNVTIYGLMLAEGNEYSPWKSATPEEEESLYVMKDALAGSTEISGGLVMTNLIELKNQSGEVTAGISGLSSNKSFTENGASGTFDSSLRFWAGASLGGSSNAPFRVYNDGRVYGTHFYGFQSAVEITSTNKEQYITNSCIDLRKTGNRIYLHSSLITKTSGSWVYTFVPDLLFPTNVEDYIGAEVVLINPHQVPVSRWGQLLNQAVASTDLFANNTSLSIYTSSVGNTQEEYRQQIYMLKNDNSVVTTTPSGANYTPNFTRFRNGAIPETGKRYKSDYAVQIYKLHATPYIRFPNGKKGNHLKAFGDIKSVGGYNYQRYAFWALDQELYQLLIQESYS